MKFFALFFLSSSLSYASVEFRIKTTNAAKKFVPIEAEYHTVGVKCLERSDSWPFPLQQIFFKSQEMGSSKDISMIINSKEKFEKCRSKLDNISIQLDAHRRDGISDFSEGIHIFEEDKDFDYNDNTVFVNVTQSTDNPGTLSLKCAVENEDGRERVSRYSCLAKTQDMTRYEPLWKFKVYFDRKKIKKESFLFNIDVQIVEFISES